MKRFSLSSQAEQSVSHLIQLPPRIVNHGSDARQVEAKQPFADAEAGARERTAPPEAKHSRLLFIDHLRASLVILVIVVHLAFTYGSSMNQWYYHDATDALTVGLVTSLTGIGMAFGLGLFFFISAYFVPGDYDRKGAGTFLRDRLLRLGLPLLIYDSLINPFVVYMAAGLPGSYWKFYSSYLLSLRGIGQGPVWFIETLLFFIVFYALWRVCSTWWSHARPLVTPPTRSISSEDRHLSPPTGAMFLYIVGLALITFVVRVWLPMGWWFQPLNVMFAEFPQYISMFILGLIASRRGWLTSMPDAVGKRWFWVALVGLLTFVLLSVLTGNRGESITYYLGGLHWQAFVYASWEAVMGVAICASLLVFYRKHVNHPGRLWTWLSANAYATYLSHPVIVVGLAYSMHTVSLHPLLKWGIAIVIAVPVCFLISSVIRSMPLARRVL
jgi:surface polysaccharide O-acyltransferase-like enzyme